MNIMLKNGPPHALLHGAKYHCSGDPPSADKTMHCATMKRFPVAIPSFNVKARLNHQWQRVPQTPAPAPFYSTCSGNKSPHETIASVHHRLDGEIEFGFNFHSAVCKGDLRQWTYSCFTRLFGLPFQVVGRSTALPPPLNHVTIHSPCAHCEQFSFGDLPNAEEEGTQHVHACNVGGGLCASQIVLAPPLQGALPVTTVMLFLYMCCLGQSKRNRAA